MSIGIDAQILTKFLIAILLLLFSSHLFGYIFSRINIPRVAGEICGGLILGPTFTGYFLPGFYQDIFLNQGELLGSVYWLGLVLLMFSSGFEVERDFSKKDKKLILALVIGTTIIPLMFGWGSTYIFNLDNLIGTAGNMLSLKLVITVALAITSIPVISKIFLDLGIIETTFAKITLATATVHDIVLWVFISIATGLVTSQALSLLNISGYILITIVFFIFALFLVPRLYNIISKTRLRLVPESYETIFIILILLLFTAIASLLDINLVFGAFLAGIVINYIKGPRFQESKKHVKNFSMAFFIPLYFAVVGIKLDLIHHLDVFLFLVFVLFAIVVQGFAVILTMRCLKYDWLSSVNLAVVLNDRGGPCIVLATLAFDLGIISENFFVTLVLLAIITSMTAGAWLKFVLSKGWPLLNEVRQVQSVKKEGSAQ